MSKFKMAGYTAVIGYPGVGVKGNGWSRCSAVIASVLALGLSVSVSAKELAPGTVISAANLNQVLTDTFEGHTIDSMLTDVNKKMILEFKWKYTLKKSEPMVYPEHWLAATKKFSGQVVYDEKARDVKGYVAGIPFPNVKVEDPNAGIKLAWNWFLAQAWVRNSANVMAGGAKAGGFNQISMDKGFERGPGGINNQFRFLGRTTEPHTIGDGSVVKKQIIMTTSPYDNAGLGAFNITYRDGRPDDVWAYLKSVRRIRRISGGNWMDSLAGTDMLADDNYGLDAHPNWYKSWKVTGKRWLLVAPHGVNYKERIAAKLSDRINLKDPPYGALIDVQYEPREVFVLEGIPPDEHPYGKKVLYVDGQYPINWQAENYDKKGQLWKFQASSAGKCIEYDGSPSICLADFPTYDLQRRHATPITVTENTVVNLPSDPAAWNPGMIEKGIAGQLGGMIK
jgi:hypothetical protein